MFPCVVVARGCKYRCNGLKSSAIRPGNASLQEHLINRIKVLMVCLVMTPLDANVRQSYEEWKFAVLIDNGTFH